MTRNPRSARFGLPLILLFTLSLPLILGQMCSNGTPQPIVPGPPVTVSSGNASPLFEFLQPNADVSVEVGDVVTITWTDSDPDNNAAITLLADPDNVFGNGNERVILPLVMEDDSANSFDLDTSSLPPASYRLIARVNDGVNPELIAVAKGRVLLFGAGLLPGNISPTIAMTLPTTNIGLSQGETAQLGHCGSDPDDGLNGVIPDIVLLLDLDQDPTNDIDLTGPDREQTLLQLCGSGGFPRAVTGAYVLGCAKDSDCAAAGNATRFPLTVDVSQIPPRPDGEPYWPRATMWDHTNSPVHSYSPGNISITSLGSGTIDLVNVGRTISGTRFYAFDAGGLAGATTCAVGDFDSDGAEDFIIVSRKGSPYGNGNVGSAHFIFGRPKEKFGGEIALSSVTSVYRGAILTMPATTGTDGITAIARVGDTNGDGRPDFIVGTRYVEIFNDNVSDDPATDEGCYDDRLPNPLHGGGGAVLGAYDHREGNVGTPPAPLVLCSNDQDLTRQTPIDGGYAILVAGANLNNTIIGLGDIGQSSTDGARFRGPWFDPWDMDSTATVRPFAIIPDNRFGETVASMPDMTTTTPGTAPNFGPTLLISAPNAGGGKGRVFIFQGQDFSAFGGGIASFPLYIGAQRGLLYPSYADILGQAIGDQLGNGSAAGDFNLDGARDILCSAPGAEREGIPQRGIVYVIFGRADFFTPETAITPTNKLVDLGTENPPRMEIWGTNAGDRIGDQQTLIGDVNQDGLPDIAFGSQFADGPGGVDSGFIGILFGGRRFTGENTFTVSQVGTAQLPGTKIFGTQPGGLAGAVINNAGDFNGDHVDDLLVCAPGEFRTVNGRRRLGVAYVIFGGPHLYNGSFTLSQVGSAQLPGIVLVSPYSAGSADEAPVDWIGAAGDVNGDGFADLLVGVSKADFVNPLDPGQRRPEAGEAYLIYGNNTGTNHVGP